MLVCKDSQPQDELLNHQMDSDEPGYNMTEICEVSEKKRREGGGEGGSEGGTLNLNHS